MSDTGELKADPMSEEEDKQEEVAPKKRRGRSREQSIGQQVANAWINDEDVEEIVKIARDARGDGQEYMRIVMRIIAEVEHEHGELDELDGNPKTVHGMDVVALLKFSLTKGKTEGDVHELLTIIGRINRRAQRRRK